MRHATPGLLFAACALAAACGCSRQHVVDPPRDSALDPGNPGAARDPGRPGGLTAEVGSGQAGLRWTIADPSRVSYFRIYRQSEREAEFSLADTSAAQAKTVFGLQDGLDYLFQVAAVNPAGYEGRRSDALVVRPGPAGVSINAGARRANSLAVVLTLSPPSGATRVAVANLASFADSAVFELAATRAWTLSSGPDGVRTVYVRYRDALGNSAATSDDILLDRLAEISAVTENSGGAAMLEGQTVRFTLASGEAEGAATVDIGGARSGLRLFDDGTHGDAAADDGVYTLDYVIEPGVEANAAAVVGRFTDAAGNVATRAASTTLTIQNTPPVAITAVVPVSTSALNVFWSPSGAPDFASYRLWRAETRNVLTAPTRAVATTVSSRTNTSFQDGGLKEDFRYYYLVEVVDAGNLASPGPPDSAVTLNDFPTPVVVDTVSTVGTDRALLTWSRNQNTDFAAYRVYQSTTPGADTTRTLAATVANQSTAYRDVTGLLPSTTYYFRVYVVDRSGRQVPSNEVDARTPP